MQNLVNDTPAKKNYAFVDSIRCISMMGIVFEHAATLWNLHYKDTGDVLVQAAGMQFFKFSTIAFFLIGGFLINYKFTEYTPGQYIKKRFDNTCRPWLIWMLILIILDVINDLVVYHHYHHAEIISNPLGFFGTEIYHTAFFTNFWFIPNFLICITLLLVFKKYLYSIWFGIFWLVASLFYSVNLYYGWIVTQHSTALFGFVFYLWLGVYLNKHYDEVMLWIKNLSMSGIIVINILTFAAATAETVYMMNKGYDDVFNTLRITNILYSLTMFVLLLKLGEFKWLTKNLSPRQTTFGIYLIHEILIIHLVIHLIYKPLKYHPEKLSAFINFLAGTCAFLVVYGLSFFITKGLLKTKAKWMVGQ